MDKGGKIIIFLGEKRGFLFKVSCLRFKVPCLRFKV